MIAVGPYTLRDDQEQAIVALRAEVARLIRDGKPPRVVMQGPTGFGKTILSSALIALMVEKGKSCAFLAHGRQLIFQKSSKLTECEIRHAVLMAGVTDDHLDGQFARSLRGSIDEQQVIVASKDTYEARAYSRDSLERFDVDVLIIDEAHASLGASWLKILNEHPNVIVIGLTATPALGNGKGLGEFYQGLVKSAGYATLIDIGALVPCRVFAPYAVDMSGVKVQANGEYSQPQAAKRFLTDELIGDVVENWKRYAEGRPTAVFAQSVAHSIELAKQFNREGVPAAHIDAESPQDEREDVFKGLATGRIIVACNYGVLRVGVDLPVLGAAQLACSMRSLTSYVQTVGRVVRSCRDAYWCEGPKRDAVIIDHGGNVYRHGWPTADREWSLDPTESVEAREKARKESEGFDGELTCFACGCVFDPRKAGNVCPNCGAKKAKRGQKVRTVNGEIREVTEKSVKKTNTDDRQKQWMRSLAKAAHCDMTVKQARILFKRMTGEWPSNDLSPMPERHENDRKVAVMYPGFLRRKAVTK